jgi:beta-glucanase (GH16 family)
MEETRDGPPSTRMIVGVLLRLSFEVWYVFSLVVDGMHLPFFRSSDTNKALHFYSHDNARTTNGVLNITTEQKVNSYMAFNEKTKKFYADKKYVQSAMLQSWNKFCFIGGIIEFSAKLPGHPDKGGLWPACTYFFRCWCPDEYSDLTHVCVAGE